MSDDSVFRGSVPASLGCIFSQKSVPAFPCQSQHMLRQGGIPVAPPPVLESPYDTATSGCNHKEERMALEIVSMLRAMLESKEREMAWDPTSHHGFEITSTYQGDLPNEYSSHEYQHGYGDGYQSWSMEHEHEATYFSQSCEEKLLNLARLALEGQERYNESIRNINIVFAQLPQDASIVEPTNEENAQVQDDFLKEAEETIKEFELLLGCTVGEDLVVRYEEDDDEGTIMGHSTNSKYEGVGEVVRDEKDPYEDELAVECKDIKEEITQDEPSIMEEEPKQPNPKKEPIGVNLMEKQDDLKEEAFKEDEENGSPMAQPFHKLIGIVSTTPLSLHDPRRIPFEEIRMKEFRGWFYDEYDPGDTNSCHIPNPKKSEGIVKLSDLKQAHLRGNHMFILLGSFGVNAKKKGKSFGIEQMNFNVKSRMMKSMQWSMFGENLMPNQRCFHLPFLLSIPLSK